MIQYVSTTKYKIKASDPYVVADLYNYRLVCPAVVLAYYEYVKDAIFC